MGKPKAKNRRQRTMKNENSLSNKDQRIAEYLTQLETHQQNFEFEQAMEAGRKLLELEPHHVVALQHVGNLLMEIDREEEAKFCFEQAVLHSASSSSSSSSPSSVELQPQTLLYLAQLHHGLESLAHYERAISLLTSLQQQQQTQQRVGRTLSNAHLAVVELFMTDLCDEEEARTRVESHLEAAEAADPANAFVWQSRAALQLVLGDTNAARKLVTVSLEMWLPRALLQLETREEEEDKEEELEETEMLEVDNENKKDNTDEEDDEEEEEEFGGLTAANRMSCSRMLLSLAEWKLARDVAATVLSHDEEAMEAHWLSLKAIAGMLRGEKGGATPPAEKEEEVEGEAGRCDTTQSLISDLHAHAEILLADKQLKRREKRRQQAAEKSGRKGKHEEDKGEEDDEDDAEEEEDDEIDLQHVRSLLKEFPGATNQNGIEQKHADLEEVEEEDDDANDDDDDDDGEELEVEEDEDSEKETNGKMDVSD